MRGDAFTDEEKARDFAYYEPLTVRDSSLSACTQAVIAAEVGHLDLAFDYMTEAALMDLDDLEHNARDGIHMASLAGAWIAAVAGFGGMRDHWGQLSFKPRLPDQVTRLRFRLMFRHRVIEVVVTHDGGHLLAARRRAARDHPLRRGARDRRRTSRSNGRSRRSSRARAEASPRTAARSARAGSGRGRAR